MIAISITTLAQVVKGQLIHPAEQDNKIVSVSTDSRKISSQSLFIALKGERFDGHGFVDLAVEKGAVAVMVEHPVAAQVPQIVVEDCRLALGVLAKWVREQVNCRVVALTGSSGKTSVKEMTAKILQQCGNVLYTQGNLNNDIGVPLTLLNLTDQHQYAVIELGANHQGEIAYTVNLVKPEAALVNNIAAAHLEGFGSLLGVAKAKGEIFTGLKPASIAIINADDLLAENHLQDIWQKNLLDKHIWRFSATRTEHVDFYATAIKITHQGTDFRLHTPYGETDIHIPLLGHHNIANALAASALAMAVGASLSAISEGLNQLQPVAGRLFPIYLNPQQLILDDSYNANVGSMKAAIDTLSTLPGYKVLVVSDMAELGQQAQSCHQQVGEAAALANIDCVMSVGKLSEIISHSSGKGYHFANKELLVNQLRHLLNQQKTITILIKGSRSTSMEEVVRRLKENS